MTAREILKEYGVPDDAKSVIERCRGDYWVDYWGLTRILLKGDGWPYDIDYTEKEREQLESKLKAADKTILFEIAAQGEKIERIREIAGRWCENDQETWEALDDIRAVLMENSK